MNRILLSLLAVAVAAVLGLGYWADSLRQENAVLTEASNRAAAALKRTQRTLALREKQIASQARKSAEAQEGLSQALQAEKPWSDTHVPTDVQKALRGAVNGLQAHGAGAGIGPVDGVQHDANRAGSAAP